MTSPNPQYTPPQQPQSNWTVGKVVALVAAIALVLVGVGALIYKVGYDNKTAEEAAKPADTVAAQTDPATVVTAPTKCGDDTIYGLPAVGGAASVVKDGDWAEIKSGETTVGLSATYAPDGKVGDVIVSATPGNGLGPVKVTGIYVWSVAMSDQFKAKLGVKRFKPTELKSSARMKAADLTDFRRDSWLMVCTTTK